MSAAAIVIRGPLGVGKTTVARALAQRLNGLHVSIDNVLAAHGLDRVEGECIPLRNFVTANALAMPVVARTLAAGKPVIFDGNFYHQGQVDDLVRMLTALSLLDVPPIIITLTATLDVCIVRDGEREDTHGPDAAAAVHYLVSRVDAGTKIDTSKMTLDEVVAAVEHILTASDAC